MLPEYTKYYYHSLSVEKQQLYKSIFSNLKARKTDFTVPLKAHISLEDILEILVSVYYDTPSFYFIDLPHVRAFRIENMCRLQVPFRYSIRKIEKYDATIMDGLELFAKKYFTENMDDYDKEIAIHRFLVNRVTYASDLLANSTDHPEIFDAIGVLRDKKAVCQGIALTFKLLCDYARIKSLVVRGSSLEENPESPGHAWNIVKLAGHSYHVDSTWDLLTTDSLRTGYDYFNLNDSLIGNDHVWNKNFYPACTSIKHNYFKRNHLYVRSVEEIPDYVAKMLEMGSSTVLFKFANSKPDDRIILSAIEKGMERANRYGSFKYMPPGKMHNVYIEFN